MNERWKLTNMPCFHRYGPDICRQSDPGDENAPNVSKAGGDRIPEAGN